MDPCYRPCPCHYPRTRRRHSHSLSLRPLTPSLSPLTPSLVLVVVVLILVILGAVLRMRIRGIRIITLDPDPYQKMAGSGSV